MKIKIGTLKRLIREAGNIDEYSFEVYGPNDETYTVFAVYDPRTPFEVEVWKAIDESGAEVEISELEAQGHDLQAKALESVPSSKYDMDPPGTGWDDRY